VVDEHAVLAMASQSLPSCPPVAHGWPTVEDEEERGKAMMLAVG
jgi:hypothetical protein